MWVYAEFLMLMLMDSNYERRKGLCYMRHYNYELACAQVFAKEMSARFYK